MNERFLRLVLPLNLLYSRSAYAHAHERTLSVSRLSFVASVEQRPTRFGRYTDECQAAQQQPAVADVVRHDLNA
jgi:hypothetical protein